MQTPLEVYRELRADGYDVEYVRLPITDEKVGGARVGGRKQWEGWGGGQWRQWRGRAARPP